MKGQARRQDLISEGRQIKIFFDVKGMLQSKNRSNFFHRPALPTGLWEGQGRSQNFGLGSAKVEKLKSFFLFYTYKYRAIFPLISLLPVLLCVNRVYVNFTYDMII